MKDYIALFNMDNAFHLGIRKILASYGINYRTANTPIIPGNDRKLENACRANGGLKIGINTALRPLLSKSTTGNTLDPYLVIRGNNMDKILSFLFSVNAKDIYLAQLLSDRKE